MSKRTLGVVIARFQAPALTPAHQYLLRQVATRVDRVLVMLGTAAVPLTKRNPLEVSLRIRMVHDWWAAEYPDGPELYVVPLGDRPTHREWVTVVDGLIAAVGIGGPAVIYCGPDGAGPIYTAAGGKHPVEMLDSAGGHASKLRADLLPRHTEDFRAGVCYAIDRKLHGPFMTVDAIIRDDYPARANILLAHKREDGDRWRLPGGFVDLADASLEAAVQREVREETGLEVSTPEYIASLPVDDWRYRSGPERIMTALFRMDRVFGAAVARDDIDDLRWVLETDVAGLLHPVHQPLWEVSR